MTKAHKFDVDVAILGAGTAGMSAYREASKYTDRIALIDGGPLGTTCARVGCMPSKLLIAAADAADHMRHTDKFGVESVIPKIDGKAVYAQFEDDHTLLLSNGRKLTAKTIIIATGSRPNIPKPFEVAGDKLIVNDDVFDWDDLPESAAVFGAGVIGLELGQALHRLGVRVHLFGRDNLVGPLSYLYCTKPPMKAVLRAKMRRVFRMYTAALDAPHWAWFSLTLKLQLRGKVLKT